MGIPVLKLYCWVPKDSEHCRSIFPITSGIPVQSHGLDPCTSYVRCNMNYLHRTANSFLFKSLEFVLWLLTQISLFFPFPHLCSRVFLLVHV